MEKLWGRFYVGPDALIWVGEPSSPVSYSIVKLTSFSGALLRRAGGTPAPTRPVPTYVVFFSTSAEFFEPKPTQLQIAYSISALRPTSGT
jgi:hypothetical protein